MLGIVFAKTWIQAVYVLVVGTIALLIAHGLNYYLGKYGWYKLLIKFGFKNEITKAGDNINKKGVWAIFVSY